MEQDNQKALADLYTASRLARLTADEHDLLRKHAEQLQKALAPVEKPEVAPAV